MSSKKRSEQSLPSKTAGSVANVVKPNISRPGTPNQPHHDWVKKYTKNYYSPGKIIRDGFYFVVTELQKHLGIRVSKKYPLKVNPSDWTTRNVNKVAKYITGYHILNFKVTHYVDEDDKAIYTKDKITWYLNRKHTRVIRTSSYKNYFMHNFDK